MNNEVLNIIARLMVASWVRNGNQVTCEQVANEIIDLNIAKINYRLSLARALFSRHKFDFQPYDLFTSIYQKIISLDRNEITFFKEDKIAFGGDGVVYKGKYSTRGKDIVVAIKLNELDISDEAICTESVIFQHLKHENIIPYYGSIERWGCKGIVLEYANAGSLNHFIRRNHEIIIQAHFASIALQTLAALKYVQVQGYVHLDVKPGNILLKESKSGEIHACLSDFGTIEKQGMTRSRFLGTYLYASPEQFYLDFPFQTANDVFSFGCVLAQMDTRERPFETNDFEFIKNELAAGRRGTFNNKLMRKEVEAIVQPCWKQDPKERPDYDKIEDYIRKTF